MVMRGIVTACMFLLALGGAVSAPSQEMPSRTVQSGPTYAVQSQMVQIFLTVTDGPRRVTDLRLEDFSLSEDGKPQKIDHLDSETVPLQIALLLDTSESMRPGLNDTQEVASSFVQSMKPGDRVTLVPFNSNISSIPQLTDDTGPVLRAIRSTRAEYRTRLYDALLYAVKILSGKEGRKAIVVFSDGEDTASTSSLNLVLNAVSRYGYPIYTVTAGLATQVKSFRAILRQLADISSGKAFFVESARVLGSAFMQVSSELRAAYVLYYYTSQSDERWHDLAVSVANRQYKVHARKGFYTGKLGNRARELERKDMERVTFDALEPTLSKENARAALREVVTPPALPREVDPLPADNPARPAARAKPNAPAFKVESHLVEVPVLVEPLDGREPPLFAEKDFQLYEDSNRREIAYFASAIKREDLQRARDLASERAGTSAPPLYTSSGEELVLGRYYLVLDDLTPNVASFLNAKKAAEEIIRKYHGPLRPFSVFFTSRGLTAASDHNNTEAMLEEIRKAAPRSDRDLSAESVTVYEATVIDRGDVEAAEVGELLTAESLRLKWTNRLGTVDGACMDGAFPCDPKSNEQVIRATLQATVAEVITRNAGYVRRNLEGVREVLNAAAADPGNYPKTIIFVSPGFVTGKGSRADASSLLESIAAEAKQRRIRIYVVDTGGSASETPTLGNAGGTLVHASLMAIMHAHATAWQFEKISPLDRLASQSGAKRLKADNDIAASVGSVISASGAIYYMAFLSRQPVDGRFHRIGVFVSSRSVRLHARPGYYARPQNEPRTASSSASEGEDLGVLLTRAEQAMKSGDFPNLAQALEGLTRKLPNRPDLWFNLGVAYFNSQNPAAAVEAFQRSLALSPEDRTAGLMLSRAFTAAGNADAAAETLQALRSRHPLDLELLIQLGRIYEAASQPGKAYQVYRSALDVTSAPPMDFYLLLIRTAALLGRRSEAGVFIGDYLAHGGEESRIESWKRMIEGDSRE
jgi:Ca-activated chloride channel homolog